MDNIEIKAGDVVVLKSDNRVRITVSVIIENGNIIVGYWFSPATNSVEQIRIPIVVVVKAG